LIIGHCLSSGYWCLVIGIYLVIVIWSLVIVLYLELEKLVIFEVAISYQQSAFFLVTDS